MQIPYIGATNLYMHKYMMEGPPNPFVKTGMQSMCKRGAEGAGAHQHFQGGQRDLGRDRVAAVGAAVLPRLDAQHDLHAPRTQA